ncbi:uncharacterized protein EV422DRAFT_524148 [Fimicolochytrium jonesii]|uniref:uncharacterized protein n=1 Tax=Fimicolochytrium jonesii TaxID=1396493 RepID=UPI0022FDC469|nr:uncharacterized protein EV422DRAFT_524148 [Fimicolochytrium jonesii]KAI8822478.1 hypothetical protein EV422DRAFT_524148 [Fimicolochytrium jonesii]
MAPPELPFDVKFQRMVEATLVQDRNHAAALTALDTLTTLLSNVLSHSTEPKFHSFRLQNKRISALMSNPHASTLLLFIGLQTRVREFQETWYFPEGLVENTERLTTARDICEGYMKTINEKAEKQERGVKSKLEEERRRKDEVLRMIEGDRLERCKKDENKLPPKFPARSPGTDVKRLK